MPAQDKEFKSAIFQVSAISAEFGKLVSILYIVTHHAMPGGGIAERNRLQEQKIWGISTGQIGLKTILGLQRRRPPHDLGLTW